jgi:CO/xanthine dehydrogenase Mo-binding subunit
MLRRKIAGCTRSVDREHLDGQNPRLKLAPHEHLKLTDDQDFIAIDKVRFDGELVAAVVAEDLRSAQRALEKIRVEYKPLPAVFDAMEALVPGAPILHEDAAEPLGEDTWRGATSTKGFTGRTAFLKRPTSPSVFHHPMGYVGGCQPQYATAGSIFGLPGSCVTDEFARAVGIEPEKCVCAFRMSAALAQIRTVALRGGFLVAQNRRPVSGSVGGA